jgi:hypothetical protein
MSTIGANELNFRVRNENGCDPIAKAPAQSMQFNSTRTEYLNYVFNIRYAVEIIDVTHRVPCERLDILVLLGSTPCGAST